MTDHDLSDEGLRARLARDLPRYTAPPALRKAVTEAAVPGPPRPVWVTPLLSAAATALLLLLAGIALLPPRAPTDPAGRLVRAVVNEHTRALRWGVRPQEGLPAAWLTPESGIGVRRIFTGDDRLRFVGAEPVYVERERGMALHYRDVEDQLVTYVVLPAGALTIPDRRRVQIDRFRPALIRDDHFAAWLWRQGGVACVIVADMAAADPLDRFKDYYLRVRLATEQFPAK